MDVWWVRRWWEAADARGLAAGELGAVTLLACGGGLWGVVGEERSATVVEGLGGGVRLDVDGAAGGG